MLKDLPTFSQMHRYQLKLNSQALLLFSLVLLFWQCQLSVIKKSMVSFLVFLCMNVLYVFICTYECVDKDIRESKKWPSG